MEQRLPVTIAVSDVSALSISGAGISGPGPKRTSEPGPARNGAMVLDERATQKAAIRDELRQKRQQLSSATVGAASAAVVARLIALPQVQSAKKVALYAACDGEINLNELFDWLSARGVELYFPRVVTPNPPTLAFHRVTAASELVLGALGIATPLAGAPQQSLAAMDVVLLPGVAFDRAGGRLGRGRGYYDVALHSAPQAWRVGICHSLQLVAALPQSATDQAMDVILTPDEAHFTHARRTLPVEDLS